MSLLTFYSRYLRLLSVRNWIQNMFKWYCEVVIFILQSINCEIQYWQWQKKRCIIFDKLNLKKKNFLTFLETNLYLKLSLELRLRLFYRLFFNASKVDGDLFLKKTNVNFLIRYNFWVWYQ